MHFGIVPLLAFCDDLEQNRCDVALSTLFPRQSLPRPIKFEDVVKRPIVLSP